uniref:Uncharacterized protein n=1 Tax=Anguilla anguilla TaxID=7936 RepID=A0A0E9QWS8_ANGAN
MLFFFFTFLTVSKIQLSECRSIWVKHLAQWYQKPQTFVVSITTPVLLTILLHNSLTTVVCA